MKISKSQEKNKACYLLGQVWIKEKEICKIWVVLKTNKDININIDKGKEQAGKSCYEKLFNNLLTCNVHHCLIY